MPRSGLESAARPVQRPGKEFGAYLKKGSRFYSNERGDLFAVIESSVENATTINVYMRPHGKKGFGFFGGALFGRLPRTLKITRADIAPELGAPKVLANRPPSIPAKGHGFFRIVLDEALRLRRPGDRVVLNAANSKLKLPTPKGVGFLG